MAALTPKTRLLTLSKRAVLLDRDNEVVAHLTYAEMDDYIERGLVERLTPVKAKTHIFRLVEHDRRRVAQTDIADMSRIDEASLTAAASRANAGDAYSEHEIQWARRRVKVWPHIGDTRAPRVACRIPKRPSRHRVVRKRRQS
jgi:hypothetical protein